MGSARVLIVDDEAQMRELIRLYLQADFDVTEAEDGLAAMRLLRDEEPDLVLLDVMMPRLDGWQVLERIREESMVPVIMLTARSDVPDRLHGLHLGADDYMAKPFDGRELSARIHAVLRRTAVLPSQGAVQRGSLTIRPSERSVTWKGRAIALTPKEFDLLLLLALHPGQVFARDLLLDRVWGLGYGGEIRTVDTHIKNLREKLADGAGMIGTVWGLGYRFKEVPDADS